VTTSLHPRTTPDPTATTTGSPTPGTHHLDVNVAELVCRSCGATQELAPTHVCLDCLGPLEVVYDTERIAARVSRERIAAGPRSLWRYGDLLPVLSADDRTRVDLATGFTPLRPAPRLAAHLGLDELWLKDDTRNPTGSFKDRVVTVALSAARAFGLGTIACASTGNLANAVAAHAAATGMASYVFIPQDLESGKVVGSAIYGGNVVAVDGNYDAVNRLAAEVADAQGWGFVNVNLRPYYAEGSTTIGYEILEQLGWRYPDHVVAPLASGAMFTRIDAAFDRARTYGLVSGDTPRMSGAQATGCSPIARAFEADGARVRPQKPDTIVRSLSIGDPADGDEAVAVARRTGGTIGHVSDAEVVEGIRLLAATEGLFAETAGGVTVANLVRFAEAGLLDRRERTVAIISGAGLKTIEAVADGASPTHRVSASLDAFEAALAG